MGKRKDWSQIGEIVEKIKELGLKYTEGAERFGTSVRDIYLYNQRLKKKIRIDESTDTPRKTSDTSTNKRERENEVGDVVTVGKENEGEKAADIELLPSIPESVREIILNYRTLHPDHGYKRIEEHLKKRYFVVISRKKIREVLKAHGLAETLDSSFDKEKGNLRKGTRRFEADYPRELYQMDVTYVYISGIPVLYLVVIVDDFSRFCVAADLVEDQKGTTVIAVLHRAIERFGKPRKLLTDQGTSFYSWSFERTLFQKYLDDHRIEHIVADPHSPQTLGKVERLHQTTQKELLHKIRFNGYPEAKQGIEEYIHGYNYNRPHQGIDGAFPSDRVWGVDGETARIETALKAKSLDFSKGYLIFKNQDHTISVVGSSMGLQIFVDGNLLKGGKERVED